MAEKVSTPEGVIEIVFPNEVKRGISLDIAGDGASCSEAYWSGDRGYTIENNCDRKMTYKITEVIIVGRITVVLRLKPGDSKEVILRPASIGIQEPIQSQFS